MIPRSSGAHLNPPAWIVFKEIFIRTVAAPVIFCYSPLERVITVGMRKAEGGSVPAAGVGSFPEEGVVRAVVFRKIAQTFPVLSAAFLHFPRLTMTIHKHGVRHIIVPEVRITAGAG